MHILLLDPFHGGSHAAVAQGFAYHSGHKVTLLTLPIDGGWRWRMRGGAVTLARVCREQEYQPDLIMTTDMLDLAAFRGLIAADGVSSLQNVPIAVYLHENQLTYPLPPGRTRDLSFAWINYTSALAADTLFFNSRFHRRSFLEALPGLLGRYYDYQELETITAIAAKAQVLAPGIDLRRLDGDDRGPRTGDRAVRTEYQEPRDENQEAKFASFQSPVSNRPSPVILWNSRWEYDKQPAVFFAALEELAARGVAFRLIIAGEHIDPNAPDFVAARERWSDRMIHWGYAPDLDTYRRLLWQADIVVSTAIQEFFGIGVIEALYCGCIPVLPRRLSYPDLLPAEHHAACLYDTSAGLVDRLQSVVTNLQALRSRDWRAVAAPYDWLVQAPLYDRALEGVTRRQGELRQGDIRQGDWETGR